MKAKIYDLWRLLLFVIVFLTVALVISLAFLKILERVFGVSGDAIFSIFPLSLPVSLFLLTGWLKKEFAKKPINPNQRQTGEPEL